METLLRESLQSAHSAWMSAGRRTLRPLIDKAAKEYGLDAQQRDLLHEFREVRNQCAHALEEGPQGNESVLPDHLDAWLEWLETQTAGDGPGPVRIRRPRPEPRELHREADAAGREAAEAETPIPMTIRRPGRDDIVETEGVAGDAAVVIRPCGDPLAEWLVAGGHARERGGQVWIPVSWPSQSMARAAVYARAYVDVLTEYEISAHYETRLD